MWAAHHGHSDTCKLLLKAGAKINLQDVVSLTWLFLWGLGLVQKMSKFLILYISLFVLMALVRLHSIDSSSKRWSCSNLHCPSGFRGWSSCRVHTRKWGRNCDVHTRKWGRNCDILPCSCLLNTIFEQGWWTLMFQSLFLPLFTGVGCWEMGRNEKTSDRCEAFKGIFMLSSFPAHYSVPLSREYQLISPTLALG